MLSVRYELQPYMYIILSSNGQSVSQETTAKSHVKFSLSTMAWGRRGIAPLIRNLGTRWGVVDITPLPHYPREITALCIELEAR